MLTEFLRIAFLHHFPFLQDKQIVGKTQRIVKIMRHKDHRRARFSKQFLQLRDQFMLLYRIQTAERLIEQQDFRFHAERFCDRHFLLLSSGKLSRQSVPKLLQPQQPEQRLHPVFGIFLLKMQERAGDIFLHIDVRIEMKILMNQLYFMVTGNQLFLGIEDLVLTQMHCPRVLHFQSGHDPQQRALARTALSDDRKKLPFVQVQRKIMQGFLRIVGFGNVLN